MRACVALLILTGCGPISAANLGLFSEQSGIHVGPVLQNATETSMAVMWETDAGEEPVVEYGPTPSLGLRTVGESTNSYQGRAIHHATMAGLEPDQRYYYRVGWSKVQSRIFHFQTPPQVGVAKPFKFVVYSDCQQGEGVHQRIVDQGIYGSSPIGSSSPTDGLGFVLVAGDVVQNGDDYAQYKQRLFDPTRNVSTSVPYYTAIGNHEENHRFYFDYMNLPKNGSVGFEEHWYSFDYGNAHIIGLDTNKDYRTANQLAWLDRDLDAACADDRIRFVFAYFHHPWKSELWLEGETPYSGEAVTRLEQKLTACGKSGAYFFGHTHGYSRGQSKEHKLYHVNAGTAGGTIDHWGEYEQRDYEEFQKSYDEYGAVIVEMNPAGRVGFRAKRITFGDDQNPKNGEVQDEFHMFDDDQAPAKPILESLATSGAALDVGGSSFSDPDGELHLESEWQVATTQDGFATPVASAWRRYENIFRDVDTMAGEDIRATQIDVTGIAADQKIYARVRYRDGGLMWSPWSEPVMPTATPKSLAGIRL